MQKQLAALCVFALAGVAGARLIAQDKPKTQAAAPAFVIPAEDAKRANPVKSSPASIADGKHAFVTQCAMCHGKDGDGKGDLAADMKLTLKDYRDPSALKDVTDGEMFYIIMHGKGDMPSEADRMKPEQAWNLINYIHSFAKKEAPKEKETKSQ
ncbi:MAG: c-type cytochrome [Candidatus Acidiferrales bacterium]